MHVSDILAASVALVPFVAAHGGIPGAPKIWGLAPHDAAKLKRRGVFGGHATHGHSHVQRGSRLAARQGGQSGACGPNGAGATCDEGYCCSANGWCGQGTDYCQAPDGLFQYGPANDANVVPSGGSTLKIPRPQLGSVPYGGDGIYHCSVPGTVAITYDDGPYLYTQGVLDMFAEYGYKATFFITGNNIGKGPIDTTSEWSTVIKNMITAGHQVASHTWTHQDLSAITSAQRYDQMVRNEMAFANILGKFPTYMRPPYSSCSPASGCPQDLQALGYVVSYFDLDTDDYNNLEPTKIQIAKNNFIGNVTSTSSKTGDWLSIAHDIHEITAKNLTKTMLDELKSLGYKGVTMGECLNDPIANWYRDAPAAQRVASSSSFSAPGSTPTSSMASQSSSIVASTTGQSSSPNASGTGQASPNASGTGQSSSTVASTTSQSSSPVASGTGQLSPVASGTGQPSPNASGTGQSSSTVASATSQSSSLVANAAGQSSPIASGTGQPSPIASGTGQPSPNASGTGQSSSTVAIATGQSSSPVASGTGQPSPNASGTGQPSPNASGTGQSSSPNASGTGQSSSTVAGATVQSSSPASSAAAAPSGLATSPDSTCGGSTGYTCLGFDWTIGTCCSQYGYCGKDSDHCGTGCQSGFGTCGSSSSPSSVPNNGTSTPTATGSGIRAAGASSTQTSAASGATPSLSTNGMCGGKSNMICSKGIDLYIWFFGTISDYGACCSKYGWCGNGGDFCYIENGCQDKFGVCY